MKIELLRIAQTGQKCIYQRTCAFIILAFDQGAEVICLIGCVLFAGTDNYTVQEEQKAVQHGFGFHLSTDYTINLHKGKGDYAGIHQFMGFHCSEFVDFSDTSDQMG